MSYKAIVTRVATRPHPNADRLQLGTCHGNQVVIGKEIIDGTLGLFFPTDGQISEEFAKANDLIRRKDENGNPAGGMFDENRRVRSQKLRGEKSDGFWVELTSLSSFGDISTLKEGDTLDEFNGTKICQKYFSKKTREARGNKIQKKKKPDPVMFHKHIDTEQFRFYADKITPNSFFAITLKVHGTSQRSGLVLDFDEPNLWEKLLMRINKNYEIKRKVWKEVIGSRNVVLSQTREAGGFYGTDEFRYQAHDRHFKNNMKKGETFYYEIVGWVNKDMPIMNPADTTKLKDKEFTKKYGDKMFFSYGCAVGTFDVYLYRITMTNEDGFSTDYSWDQVCARARELGVKTVPELARGMYFGDPQSLRELVEELTEGDDLIDSRHIREGVVIRVQSEGHFEPSWYKNKSHTFGVLEGYIKDAEVVDLEEIS